MSVQVPSVVRFTKLRVVRPFSDLNWTKIGRTGDGGYERRHRASVGNVVVSTYANPAYLYVERVVTHTAVSADIAHAVGQS